MMFGLYGVCMCGAVVVVMYVLSVCLFVCLFVKLPVRGVPGAHSFAKCAQDHACK